MTLQVEVRTAVDTLYFLEAKGHLKLDVRSCVGVVRQLLVVVVAVLLVTEAESLVPAKTQVLPEVEPLELLTRADEELHLHLLELAHTEDELTGNDLIAEGLTDLCDTEGHLHTACLLHIEEVHEDPLSRLGAQIDLHRTVGRGAHLGGEHEVELTDLRPVARAADGADDLVVEDDLTQLLEVGIVHSSSEAVVQLFPLSLILEYAAVGRAELCFVEALAELLRSLGYLLIYLLLDLGQLILDEDVSAVALLRVLVVDEGVIEGVDVARGLPDLGVHEDR